MIKINIEIDVKNHDQIIKKRKGALMKSLSSLMGNSKEMVEDEIRKEVKKALKVNLEKEFEKQEVEAIISIY